MRKTSVVSLAYFFVHDFSSRESRVMGMIARVRVSLTMVADSRVLVWQRLSQAPAVGYRGSIADCKAPAKRAKPPG